MPGTIISVKVSAGQHVKKHEVLVILEAMKMENEIVTPRDGVVAQVVVSKGASVNTDDALIILQ
jgi:biotin carboxyl carrier protein